VLPLGHKRQADLPIDVDEGHLPDMAFGVCPVEAWEHPKCLFQCVPGAQGNKDNREGRSVRGAFKLDGEQVRSAVGRRFHLCDIPWRVKLFSGKSMSAKISADWAIGSAGPGTLTFGVAHSFPGEDVMLDIPFLSSIARQMMGGDKVEIEGRQLPVSRTSRQCLRIVASSMGGRDYSAIEQNPQKPSPWGKLAREGHQVVQFNDVKTNKFVAVAVNGEAKEYGGGRSHR
jgi:hypothetical protein